MAIYALGDLVPRISASAYVHPDAVVIGNVSIGDDASIWPCAVLRGDYGTIEIGARTSIQDGAVVHCTAELATVIGSDCVVGHNAYLEGCVVEDNCLVGASSLVLQRARVERSAVVAAGAVVREGATVKRETIVAGVPAVERGPVNEEMTHRIRVIAEDYVTNGQRFARQLRKID